MELQKVNKLIYDIVQEIDTMKDRWFKIVKDRAEGMAEYDKSLAKTIIQLKNGKEFELDGSKISNPIASNAEKIAKGVCWKEKLNKEQAEGTYKAYFVKLDILKTQMNGLQSIKKHAEEI